MKNMAWGRTGGMTALAVWAAVAAVVVMGGGVGTAVGEVTWPEIDGTTIQACQGLENFAGVVGCYGALSANGYTLMDGSDNKYNPLNHLPGQKNVGDWMVHLKSDGTSASKKEAKDSVDTMLTKLILRDWVTKRYISIGNNVTKLSDLGISITDWKDEGCPDLNSDDSLWLDNIDDRCGNYLGVNVDSVSWTAPDTVETRENVKYARYGGYGKYYYKVSGNLSGSEVVLQKAAIYVEPVHYKGIVAFVGENCGDEKACDSGTVVKNYASTVTFDIWTSGLTKDSVVYKISTNAEGNDSVTNIPGRYTPSEPNVAPDGILTRNGTLTLSIAKGAITGDTTLYVALVENEVPLKFKLGAIDPSITITTQPQDTNVTEGKITNKDYLYVVVENAATIDDLKYQWYERLSSTLEGVAMKGETGDTLRIPQGLRNDENGGEKRYYVVISIESTGEELKSSEAKVTVKPREYTLRFATKPTNADTLTAKFNAVGGKDVVSGTTPVPVGSMVVFTVTPTKGYHVTAWKVDGKIVQQSGDTTYEHTTTANDTISVELASNAAKYRLTYATPTIGAEALTAVETESGFPVNIGTTDITADEDVLFSLTRSPGYRVVAWTVNGAVVEGEKGDTYRHKMTADATIAVELEATYKLTFAMTPASGAGTLEAKMDGKDIITNETEIPVNTIVLFRVTPATGYHVTAWKVNGQIVATTGEKYEHKTTANATISVELVRDAATYKLTFAKPDNATGLTANVAGGQSGGTPVTSGVTELPINTMVNFTVTPMDGYRVKEWKIGPDVVAGQTGNTYVHTTTATATISVVLEEIPVAPEVVTRITITGGTEVAEGGTLPLTIEYTPTGATDIVDYTNKKWTSSNTAVAAVTEEGGVVTGVAAGTATITAKAWKSGETEANAKTATVTITVTKPKYTVTFTSTDPAKGTVAATSTINGVTTALTSGAEVTIGSTVTFTAAPLSGNRVKEWKIGGQPPNGTSEVVSGAGGTVLAITGITAAKAVTVAFEAMPAFDISVTPSSWDFGKESIPYGSSYLPPALPPTLSKTITVTNTGAGEIGLSQPPTSAKGAATNYVVGTLAETSLKTGETATFTVYPNGAKNLTAGIYEEDIKIEGYCGGEPIQKWVTVTFTVLPPDTYGIVAAPDSLGFKTVTIPYARPAARIVDVKNAGSVAVTLKNPTVRQLSPAASPEGFFVGPLGTTDLAAKGEGGDVPRFAVWPNENLPAGVYEIEVTVEGTSADARKETVTAKVKAVFTVEAAAYCNVTWQWNAGGGEPAPEAAAVDRNTRITAAPATVSRNGYTFVGWYRDELKTLPLTFPVTIVRDTVFYGKWNSPSGAYRVAFNANGGSAVSPPYTTTVNGRFALDELPTPERYGYNFNSWYNLKTGGAKVTLGTVFADDATVYAHWDTARYNITYALNGGTVAAPGNPSFFTVETPAFKLVNPAKPGYEFTGWMDADSVDLGTDVRINPKSEAGSKRFIASWEDGEYTITFNTAGGVLADTALAEAVTVPGGWITYLPSAAAVTRDGYTFKGWYTEWEGGSKVELGAAPNANGTPGKAGTVFSKSGPVYAQWNIVTYKITYDLKGGAVDAATPNPATYTVESGGFELNNPVRAGYMFIGWTGVNGRDTITEPEMYIYIEYRGVGDRKFTANWGDPVSYTVKFDVNVAGVEKPEDGKTGAGGRLTTLPPAPKRDGYSFDAWYTAAEGGKQVTTSTLFVSDSTVYARWYIPFTVTLNANGGDVSPKTLQTRADSTLLSLPTAYRDGYVTAGWYTSAAGGTQVTTNTKFGGDATLYAHWSAASAGVLTFKPGANGTLRATVDGAQIASGATVQGGKNVVFTAAPIDGYGVVRWTKNGVVMMDSSRTYTLYGFSGATEVMVTFDAVYISVASPDRVVPGAGAGVEAAVAPPAALPAEFAAGPNPAVRSPGGEVKFYHSGAGIKSVALLVYDESGKSVRRIVAYPPVIDVSGRRVVAVWDLKDAGGRSVPEGAYLVRGVLKTASGRSERVSAVVGVR